ncbi:MAG: transposase [Bacteroidetes bacterium]|nr:transposase [Bacteroidota bacterium]
MTKYKNLYRVESARLKEWDYSSPWWYYVTINTKNHVEYFGRVVNSKMRLNEVGKVAENCWLEIPNHFANVELDSYVIMPNHLHGIIIINSSVETGHAPSLQKQTHSLSTIIGSFKSGVTKGVHNLGCNKFSWQQRFYDRIIRNEKELYHIRKYIELNPMKWELEKEMPENLEF